MMHKKKSLVLKPSFAFLIILLLLCFSAFSQGSTSLKGASHIAAVTDSTGTPVENDFQTVHYYYTGAVQIYKVPLGVNTITVDVLGAQGGAGGLGGQGGLGGRVTGTIAVKPFDVLAIYVGGSGAPSVEGYNGGGRPAGNGGGGGGASDIRLNGHELCHRVVVAGGGSGGSQGRGGAGGNLVGGQGSKICLGSWAGGGTQSAGGAGGRYNCGSCAPGAYSADGRLGIGGDGSTGTGGCDVYGGAGGGGGYYGGGGMQINGAGGGSSYLLRGKHTQAYQSGNGEIIIAVPKYPALKNIVSSSTLALFDSAGKICAEPEIIPVLPATDSLAKNETDLSFQKTRDLSVKLYPNPNQGLFYLTLSEEHPATISISSALGQIILQKEAKGLSTIDLSTYQTGQYHVRVRQNGQLILNELVIVD